MIHLPHFKEVKTGPSGKNAYITNP